MHVHRSHHIIRAASVAAAAILVGMLVARSARADLVPPGEKYIHASYELVGAETHPDQLFVAFPFGVCYSWSEDFFRLNPQLDVAEQNYEVLRPGERYQVHKFCADTQIYALDRSAFTVRTETLSEDLDWYRKRGLERIRIAELDRLRTTEKLAFFASDARVRRSGQRVNFPLTTFAASPVTATHELLRIVEASSSALVIAPEAVILTLLDAKLLRRDYRDGVRPLLDVGPDELAHAQPTECEERVVSEPPTTPEQAAGTLTVPPAPRSPIAYVGGAALLVAIAFGVSLGRRARGGAR